MSTIRNLLIDCRIALRGATAGANEALLDRLEDALQGMLKTDAAGSEKRSSSQQVALAWQTAARSLKVTQPEVYTRLNERVLAILDTRSLSEPTDELIKLEAALERQERDARWRQEEIDRLESELDRARDELADLRQQLAAAAPDVAPGDDPQKYAQLCIQELVRASKRTGPGLREPKAGGESDAVPTRVLAEQVAAGARTFTSAQRDWSIGEAMCLTGWEFTPVEMLEKGDPWLAKLLLEKASLE